MYNSGVDFQNLLAFVPAYTSLGRVTRLHYRLWTVESELSVVSIARRACREFSLDPQGLRNAARFVSGSPNMVPLPLWIHGTFFPIKTLAPRVKGDSAYGFYLLQGIVRVEKAETGSTLVMLGGTRFNVLQTRTVVMNHIARALLFERIFWSRRLGESYITLNGREHSGIENSRQQDQ
ncbi:MAG TPA: hypothetical protein VK905_06395 [Bacillota bacterium]|nr:hypothetical protein [Bacillota bacterium]